MPTNNANFLYFSKDASFLEKQSIIKSNSITFIEDKNTIYANGHKFVAEDPSNKITAINASSTNDQYPSAKCIYDSFGNIIINQTNSSVEINPNVMNLWGEISALTITLAVPADNNRTNEYMLQFTSPSSAATTFSYPNTIVWGESNATVEVGGVIVPNIEAGKTYQVSIVNNKGVIGGF